MKPDSLQQIVNGRLCVDCGACAYVSEGRIEMRDLCDQGWRPTPLSSGAENLPTACLAV